MRYLLITFFKKSNGRIDEQVIVSKKIKNSDQQTCNVILDYQEKKVVKSIIEGNRIDTDFEKMSTYYKKVYPTLIDQLEKNNIKM